MAPEIAAALISAGGSAAAAGINAGSGALRNRLSYKWTKRMYDYQNSINLRDYSPAAVMQRYRDAGLNPNLVAGTSVGSNSSQGSMSADYQSPIDRLGGDLSSGVQAAISTYMAKKNLDNATAANQALIELQKAQRDKTMNDSNRIAYYNSSIQPWEAETSKYKSQIAHGQVGVVAQQEKKLMQEIGLLGMQKQKYQLGIDMMELEKQYADLYYRSRARSVANDATLKGHQAGIAGLDLKNYQLYGIRPQDPFYARLGANLVNAATGQDDGSIWSYLWRNLFKKKRSKK